MPSLREVKDRIASVRSTLKITSAMKLVASSKLRRAQRSIEALRPYADTLSEILATASGSTSRELPPMDFASLIPASRWDLLSPCTPRGRGAFPPTPPALTIVEGPSHLSEMLAPPVVPQGTSALRGGHGRPRSSEATPAGVSPAVGGSVILSERSESKNLAILAFSSNSSMCGAFNANVIKKTLEVARECEWNVEFWAFGRKMAEALRKEGHPATRDYSALVGHSSFDAVAKVAAELRALQQEGAISGAVLVYNHFVSTGKQQVVVEQYLSAAGEADAGEDSGDRGRPWPREWEGPAGCDRTDGACSDSAWKQTVGGMSEAKSSGGFSSGAKPAAGDTDCILEPSAPELLETLMPQVLDLKLYAALLDSAASEHAARMIAMQTATDNAEELLASLTLEYNKGRQQKITSEILDLVGAEA